MKRGRFFIIIILLFLLALNYVFAVPQVICSQTKDLGGTDSWRSVVSIGNYFYPFGGPSLGNYSWRIIKYSHDNCGEYGEFNLPVGTGNAITYSAQGFEHFLTTGVSNNSNYSFKSINQDLTSNFDQEINLGGTNIGRAISVVWGYYVWVGGEANGQGFIRQMTDDGAGYPLRWQINLSNDDYSGGSKVYGVAGEYFGRRVYAVGQGINAGGYQYGFLRTYDSNGFLAWGYDLLPSNNNAQESSLYAVTLDSALNVFVAGLIADHWFVAKYDPSGTQLWNRTWSFTDSGVTGIRAMTYDGLTETLYLGGTSSSGGTGYNTWLIKRLNATDGREFLGWNYSFDFGGNGAHIYGAANNYNYKEVYFVGNDPNQHALVYILNGSSSNDYNPPNLTINNSPSVVYACSTCQLNFTMNYTDVDNDNGTVYINVYRNGILLTNDTFSNVSNGTTVIKTINTNFSVGDIINATAYSNDLWMNSTIVYSNNITLQEGTPNLDLNFSNQTLDLGQSVIVNLSQHFSDPNNLILTYTNQSNAVSNLTVNGNILTILVTNVGTILVNITANNSDGFSKVSNNFNITVLNLPSLTNISITPSTAYTNSTLSVNTTYTDLDNDNGSVYFKWYVNENNSYSYTIDNVTNGTNVVSTLTSGNFSLSDVVNVTVYSNDGIGNSSTLISDSITIQAIPVVSNPNSVSSGGGGGGSSSTNTTNSTNSTNITTLIINNTVINNTNPNLNVTGITGNSNSAGGISINSGDSAKIEYLGIHSPNIESEFTNKENTKVTFKQAFNFVLVLVVIAGVIILIPTVRKYQSQRARRGYF